MSSLYIFTLAIANLSAWRLASAIQRECDEIKSSSVRLYAFSAIQIFAVSVGLILETN